MGFNLDGLPMGIQAIGRPRADLDLLRLAWASEQATSWRT
jgi:amidase